MSDLEHSALTIRIGISQIQQQTRFGTFHRETNSFIANPYECDLNVFDVTDF
jgi:hypothetical protein